MRKWLNIMVLALVGLLLTSAIKTVFKYLSELNRDAQKVLVTPQVIRFEDGSTDEVNFPPRPSVSEQLTSQNNEIVICGAPTSMEYNGINCKATDLCQIWDLFRRWPN